MGISGRAGNLRGKLIDGGNIFEGPREQVPAATLSEAYTNPDKISRMGCAYCGYCVRFGCMIGAKAQPSNTLLPVIQGRKNFMLRTGSRVTRVLHREGRAEGVQYVAENGEEVIQPARSVMLASFTLSNTRLLLLSKIGAPYDPATGKGTLGKNMTHQVQQTSPVFFDRPFNGFMGAGGMSVAFADFEGGRAHAVTPELLRGGTFFGQNNGTQPISVFGIIPPGAAASRWDRSEKKLRFSGTTSLRICASKASISHTGIIIWISIPPTPIKWAIHCSA